MIIGGEGVGFAEQIMISLQFSVIKIGSFHENTIYIRKLAVLIFGDHSTIILCANITVFIYGS